jgi:hypothetical protein
MVDFRNIVVHEYERTAIEVLKSILRNSLLLLRKLKKEQRQKEYITIFINGKMMRNRSIIQSAVLINNKGYEASLEMGKPYRIISNENAESHGYSEDRFYRLEVPQSLKKTLLKVFA